MSGNDRIPGIQDVSDNAISQPGMDPATAKMQSEALDALRQMKQGGNNSGLPSDMPQIPSMPPPDVPLNPGQNVPPSDKQDPSKPDVPSDNPQCPKGPDAPPSDNPQDPNAPKEGDQQLKWGDRMFTVHPDGSAEYTVVKGDCVWFVATDVLKARTGKQPSDADIITEVNSIAKASGLTENGRNPDLIYPNDKLIVPPAPKDDGGQKPPDQKPGDTPPDQTPGGTPPEQKAGDTPQPGDSMPQPGNSMPQPDDSTPSPDASAQPDSQMDNSALNFLNQKRHMQ